MSRPAAWIAILIAALATIGCDRVTKHAASEILSGSPDRSYFGGTIRLSYAENPGGFLSLGAELPPLARTVSFVFATGLAMIGFVAVAVKGKLNQFGELGVALFVAGGFSNWIDRIVQGRVVDFLNLGVGWLRTGIFNVADVAVTLGVGLFVLAEFRKPCKTTPARSS